MKSRFLAFITTMALFALTLMIPVRFAAQDQKPTSDVTGSSTWVRSGPTSLTIESQGVLTKNNRPRETPPTRISRYRE